MGFAMLVRREHSALELKQKLTAKGCQPEDIVQAIDLLIKQKYQDDARFAAEFVQMRVNQGKGSQLIRQQLQQKGIEDFLIEGFDFFELAKTIKIKKYGKQPPKNYADKAKQMRFLQSRGFGFDEISAAFQL